MVERGELRLHDAVRPALTAGTYRFDISTDSSPGQPPFAAERWLSVESAPFRIADHDIVSVYPMPNTIGDFSEQLPWVALRRRTLPWERRGATGDPASPWLALVITAPSEATLADMSLRDAIGPAAAQFPSATAQVTALRFTDVGALAAIVPREAEGRLLCHEREVNLADSELAGRDDDGWMAIVLANRLPRSSAPESWRATLVSLERRDDLAAGTPATASLVAVSTWEFRTEPAGGSFQTLMQGLGRARFAAELEGGAASLPWTGHDGVTVQARYRSPLAPVTGQTADPTDVTERAARELGRLAAAADGRLLRELIARRRQTTNAAARAVTAHLLDGAALATRAATGPRSGRPAHLSAALMAVEHLAGARVPAARPAGVTEAAPARRDRTRRGSS